MGEEFMLERLIFSREEAVGLLDQEYNHDKQHSRGLGLRGFDIPAMWHNSKMGRIVEFAEAVRLLDWAVILIIFTIASTLGTWFHPTTRPFPLPSYLFPASASSSNVSDTAITLASGVPTMFPYPHGSSTVPYAVVLVVSLAVPFILIAFLMLFVARIPLPLTHGASNIGKASAYRLRLCLVNTYILGLLLSLALTLFATDLLKNVIGKQRPDFWGRCGGVVQDLDIISRYTIPDYGLSGTSNGRGTRMVTWEVCQNYYDDVAKPTAAGVKRVSRGTLQDGWRSFPSGHASISFAGLGYLSLFLAYGFRVLGSRRKVREGKGGRRSILALVATVVPVLAAGYISATRYADLMHGGIDICAGAVLGVLGVAVGWGWYAVEAQVILVGEGVREGEELEEKKRNLPAKVTGKPGADVVPVMVRMESADEISTVR